MFKSQSYQAILVSFWRNGGSALLFMIFNLLSPAISTVWYGDYTAELHAQRNCLDGQQNPVNDRLWQQEAVLQRCQSPGNGWQ